MIVKNRTTGNVWAVYVSFTGNTDALTLIILMLRHILPPLSGITQLRQLLFLALGVLTETNGFASGSGYSYINYLFATLAGVSKVGSYTGTGADLNVDCGFTGGARFILIKRTDSTGDWYCLRQPERY